MVLLADTVDSLRHVLNLQPVQHGFLYKIVTSVTVGALFNQQSLFAQLQSAAGQQIPTSGLWLATVHPCMQLISFSLGQLVLRQPEVDN